MRGAFTEPSIFQTEVCCWHGDEGKERKLAMDYLNFTGFFALKTGRYFWRGYPCGAIATHRLPGVRRFFLLVYKLFPLVNTHAA